MNVQPHKTNASPMLNLYPDSIGERLSDAVGFLENDAVRGAFSSAYILPSVFNTDLDRGFSIIDYQLNRQLADESDLKRLKALGIDLKLDFLVNHASVLSAPFQDILKNGDASPYRDFFIDWNRFWQGHGEMTADGYIQPDPTLIRDMFFRKPGLPILMVCFPDGKQVPYWNTFYQEVIYPRLDAQDLMLALAGIQYQQALTLAHAVNAQLECGVKPGKLELGAFTQYREELLLLLEERRKYLGQMDFNVESPLVWRYFAETLARLAGYGSAIVRLDAFAYASKKVGARNFLNEPETWELLEKVQDLANDNGLSLLPEIHASYIEKTYRKLADKGYMTYDFFLPGLVIDALETGNGATLQRWAMELSENHIQTVNMLGCHDGIPLLDLKGLLPEKRIEELISTVVARGGIVKDLHGQKNVYYQVNATYFSALGEDERKLLLARALQLFMPGKPQVWYLDLFAGKNDITAVNAGGSAAHKEINRTNLSVEAIESALKRPIVQNQLQLLRFRNAFPAFGFDAALTVTANTEHHLSFTWEKKGYTAVLEADLHTFAFTIHGYHSDGSQTFDFCAP
jgi:sucrose phosphorylase